MTLGGDYSSSQSYDKLTCVQYDGCSWVSKTQVPEGVAPTPANSAYWQKISERGVQGATGAPGQSYVDKELVPIVNDLTTGGTANVLSAEQGKILDTKLTELSENNGGIPVPVLNEFIKEMYCSSKLITNTNQIAILYNSSAETITLSFRNSGTDIMSVNIRKDNISDSACIANELQRKATFIFFLDESKWEKVAQLNNTIYNTSISDNVLTTYGKPNICNLLYLNETFRNVSYEMVQGFRITTSGEIVSSTNTNWFYTKPIAIKKHDVILYQNAGNATTAVIAYTDVNGSQYEIAPIKYTGKDPDKYTLIADRDGYISVCGLANIAAQYLFIGESAVISALKITEQTPTVQVVDNLETTSADKALSANQGVQLKRMIDTLSPSLHGTNYNDVPLSCKELSPEYLSKAKDEWSSTNGEVGDRVSVYDEVNGGYKGCRELKVTNNSLFTTPLDKPIDITTKAFRFAIKLGEIAEEYRRTLQIRLYSNNSIDDAHLCRIRLQAPYNSNLPKRTRYGWWCGAINAYHAGYKFSSFDATQVTHCGIYFENSNQPVSIFVDEIGFSEAKHTGGAVIVIDNYNNAVPLMADYAFEKGVKLNLSMMPNKIGVTFGSDIQATLDEINRGKAQGHLIFNHTFNHNASEESEQTSLDEINNAQKWMLNNGFARGSRIVSVPSSLFPEEKYMAYMKSNAASIYHNWITPPNPIEPAAEGYLIHYPYAPAARFFNISALDSNVSTSNPTPYMNYLVDAVREAVNSKGYVVLGFHGTFWQRDNGVLWKKFIDDIASIEGVHFYGMDEVLENMIS